jgi:hypothetical protein
MPAPNTERQIVPAGLLTCATLPAAMAIISTSNATRAVGAS